MTHSAMPACPDLAPPWNTAETWQEANRSVGYHIRRYCSHLGHLKAPFLEIKAGMASIFLILDAICADTCPWCPEPCCLAATVWFDIPDVLFLHLNHSPLPPSQPKPDLTKPCRYLGPKGCHLPRSSRPWICTWYLCDTQLACLRKKDKAVQDAFAGSLQAVKMGRKTLETEFIRIVTAAQF